MFKEDLFKKAALFLGGVLFGTAGIALLASKDAKKVYTQGTAAVLRAKECVMTKVTDIQESADDILANAKEINEKRELENAAEVIEDAAEEIADAAGETDSSKAEA
jgi:hypothetical protein